MVSITQMLAPSSKYNIKCPNSMNPEFIVIHNTANNATAMNEISYMIRNNNTVSFHYAVDDLGAVQGLPLDRNGWHAGDGGNGSGNRKSIAIEICHSLDPNNLKFVKSEENGARLTAMLLKSRGWDTNKVKKHQDFSGKYCPHRTLDKGWGRFLNMVQTYLNELATTPTTPPSTLYYIQVGAYGNRANAEKRVADLKAQGINAIIKE